MSRRTAETHAARRLAVITCLALSVASACSSDGPHAKLVAIGTDNTGGALGSVHPGDSYVFPIRSLCTTGSPLTITKVEAANATGGLKVRDWGVRHRFPGDPYPTLTDDGAAPGLVTQFPGFGHNPVTVDCSSKKGDNIDQMDISVSITTHTGHMSGVWLYDQHGHRTASQYALTLCASHTCKPDESSNGPT